MKLLSLEPPISSDSEHSKYILIIGHVPFPFLILVRFEKLHGQPEWAVTAEQRKRQRKRRKRRGEPCDDTDSESERGSDSEEEGGNILTRTGDLLVRSVESLPKGTIDLKRMKDANSVKRAQAVVRSVEFHPTASVLLTAGYHKTVDLFQVRA